MKIRPKIVKTRKSFFGYFIGFIILIIILNLIVAIATSGSINPMLWLIFPSILFEELTENYIPQISDIFIFNAIFASIFWLTIATILLLVKNFVKKPKVTHK